MRLPPARGDLLFDLHPLPLLSLPLFIDFFLIMGVLLGAVRDKNFIKWDWDVELGLIVDTIIGRVSEIRNKFESRNMINFYRSSLLPAPL